MKPEIQRLKGKIGVIYIYMGISPPRRTTIWYVIKKDVEIWTQRYEQNLKRGIEEKGERANEGERGEAEKGGEREQKATNHCPSNLLFQSACDQRGFA